LPKSDRDIGLRIRKVISQSALIERGKITIRGVAWSG